MIKNLLRTSENLYDLRGWREWLSNTMAFLFVIILPVSFIFTFPAFISHGNYFLIALDLVLWILILLLVLIPGTALYFRTIIFMFVFYLMTISFFMVLGPHYARSGWLLFCAVMGAIFYGIRGAIISSLLNVIILLALYFFYDATSIEWSRVHNDGLGHWLMFVVNLAILSIGASMLAGFVIDRLDKSLLEERRAKEKLQGSEKRYREIVDFLPISIFETDNAGSLISFNRTALKVFRYKEEDYKEGMNALQFFPSEEWPKFGENLKKVIQGASIPDDEYTFLRKDGSTFTGLVYSAPNIQQNKPVGIRGAIIDITERREAEEKFRLITENMLDCVALVDTNGTYQYISPSYKKILGYDQEDILGITGFDVIHPADLARITKLYLEGLEHGWSEASFEARIRHKDGHYIVMDIRVQELKDPQEKLIGGILTARDITKQYQLELEREQSKAALEESEQNYRELATYHKQLNDISIALTEASSKEDLFNRIAESFRFLTSAIAATFSVYNQEAKTLKVVSLSTDQKSHSIAGSIFGPELFEMRMPVSADDKEHMMSPGIRRLKDLCELSFGVIPQEISSVVMDAVGCQQIVALAISYDEELIGTCVAYLPGSQPVVPDDALKTYMYLSAVAIKGKQEEEEKRNLEERLQRSEKMEALGQMAGGVAHDLNNVLGVLTGYSELLLNEIPKGQRSKGYVEKILQSTEKGAAIIQDLLTLARRGVTSSDVININAIVSGFLENPVFEKIKDYHPRVTFKTECDKNLLNIKGSPVHLEKTLVNLVANAAESISGEGKVNIRTVNSYLDKPIQGYDEVKEGDYAVLTVSDTGMGIPAENIKKIFEPFYTKKTMGRSGTGLGLAIVWGTVKDHNGYIDLQTKVGEGTTFTLYFPITRDEFVTPQKKEAIELYMGNGESVLVVDDIAEQRDVASGLIASLGYNVHVVSGGEEAVEYLQGNKVNILVLDMIMEPGIDGLETYRRVLEINPQQKAILVSGFSETDRVREAQKLGAGAYVRKPYTMEKIAIAVRDELTR